MCRAASATRCSAPCSAGSFAGPWSSSIRRATPVHRARPRITEPTNRRGADAPSLGKSRSGRARHAVTRIAVIERAGRRAPPVYAFASIMNRATSLGLLFILTWAACGDDNEGVPTEILPESRYAAKCVTPRTGTDPDTGKAYADVHGSL